MISAEYSHGKGWKYKDVYREKSNLTKEGLLYELKYSYHLDELLHSDCSYIGICGEIR